MGLQYLHQNRGLVDALQQRASSATTLEMLGSPVFWLLYEMFIGVSASGLMATAQLDPIAKDYGMSNTAILFGASTLSVALVVDNVLNGLACPFFGGLSDRIGRENNMALAFTLGALSSVCWPSSACFFAAVIEGVLRSHQRRCWLPIPRSRRGVQGEASQRCDRTSGAVDFRGGVDTLVARPDTGCEAHDLRARHAGRLTFLELNIVVPGSMTVAAAHQICDRIENALRVELGHLIITIHLEPEEKAKQDGVAVI
jgi:hypothetical protein